MIIKTKTIENDEDFLRQRSKEVDFNDENLKSDIELLKEYCKQTECFAFAAVQIGIPKRIVYLKNTDLNAIGDKNHNEAKILINPVIIKRKGHTQYWEACLSCLDNMGLVSRPYEMELKYFDENGNEHYDIISGFKATVLSHELDHLDGILHIDVAEEILNMPKEERKIFKETHTYNIISQTCDYDKEVGYRFPAMHKRAQIKSIGKDFEKIIDKYEDEMFKLFKEHIDSAVDEAKMIKLDNFDIYIYVNQKIEDCYHAISILQGRSEASEPDLREKLIDKIYTYIEPITKKAKEYIKVLADDVIDSSTLIDLNENYDILKSKLEKLNSGLDLESEFEDIELGSFKKLIVKKYLH